MTECGSRPCFQAFFQTKQRTARQRDNLRRVINQLDIVNTHGADDDNRAVVIGTVWGRATGEASIRGLHDNGHVRFDAGLERTPHFNQVTRTHHRQRFTAAKSPSPSESSILALSVRV